MWFLCNVRSKKLNLWSIQSNISLQPNYFFKHSNNYGTLVSIWRKERQKGVFMHLSIVSPISPNPAEVESTRRLDLTICIISRPWDKFPLQISQIPHSQQIWLSARKMKIAIVYTYSTECRDFRENNKHHGVYRFNLLIENRFKQTPHPRRQILQQNILQWNEEILSHSPPLPGREAGRYRTALLMSSYP